MTHTIKIPVAEFLENGGVLIEEREIYRISMSISGEFYLAGLFYTMCNNDCLIVLDKYGDPIDSLYIYDTFVEIECTPIYK